MCFGQSDSIRMGSQKTCCPITDKRTTPQRRIDLPTFVRRQNSMSSGRSNTEQTLSSTRESAMANIPSQPSSGLGGDSFHRIREQPEGRKSAPNLDFDIRHAGSWISSSSISSKCHGSAAADPTGESRAATSVGTGTEDLAYSLRQWLQQRHTDPYVAVADLWSF
jgi:hypothetical protein